MNSMENVPYKIEKGYPLPLGVSRNRETNRVQITLWAKDAKKCKLHLFCRGKQMEVIPLQAMSEHGVPDVFSVQLAGENVESYLKECEYTFEVDHIEVIDPYAREIKGRDEFGKKGKIRAKFNFSDFNWRGERRKEIAFEDSIIYQCHVRGFTKHKSSGVKYPGTFLGVAEKIDYLKQLGVNTLLFLPFYDFNESIPVMGEKKKVNYWGYTKDSFYFAPKASYGTGLDSPIDECKKMIKLLHQNGIQIIMDMHFEGKTFDYILECLRYYVMEFHVDGFLLNQNIVPTKLIVGDPVIRNVKLLGTKWEESNVSENGSGKTNFQGTKLANFNDQFLVTVRRFLKSDEGQVMNFYHRFKNQGSQVAAINYITEKNGFTLQDLVSYDIKHNEKNGEKNKDGTEYNFSWNCGQEGPSRRKTVREMRKQQVKNGLVMLLLSLGTPMLLAGDEFGNSQKGNNNAYCQDNTTTWLDWNLVEKNNELFEFTKMLIEFRKNQGYYHNGKLQGIDYRGVGIPDVSCHGIEPWVSNFVNYSREVGVLFYGSYFPLNEKERGYSVYVAFNMHWEPHTFFLPGIDTNQEWQVVFDTTSNPKEKMPIAIKNEYVVDPRSIVLFTSVSIELKNQVQKKQVNQR